MFKYLLALLFLLLMHSCSFKHGTVVLYNEVSGKKLNNRTLVNLNFNPEKWVPTVYDEYAHELDNIHWSNYEELLRDKLIKSNIYKVSEPSRFQLNVYEIRFTESTSRSCVSEEMVGEEECFDLNDLGVHIRFTMTDTKTGKTIDERISASENTRVKKDIVFKYYKESTLHQPYANMMRRLMGRACNRFTKFVKKHK